MKKEWLSRLVQATVITLAMAAIFQELEKPAEERKWHGKVARVVPYDFRLPTFEKFKKAIDDISLANITACIIFLI